MYVIFVDTTAVNVDTGEKVDLQKGRRFVSSCGAGRREGRCEILFDADGKIVAVVIEAVRREGRNGKQRKIVFQLEASPVTDDRSGGFSGQPRPSNLPSMRQYHGDYFRDDR